MCVPVITYVGNVCVCVCVCVCEGNAPVYSVCVCLCVCVCDKALHYHSNLPRHDGRSAHVIFRVHAHGIYAFSPLLVLITIKIA